MDARQAAAFNALSQKVQLLERANNSCVEGLVKLQKRIETLEQKAIILEQENEELKEKIEAVSADLPEGEEYLDSPS